MSGPGFGAPFTAMPLQAVDAAATPPSGNASEVIWHQLYDTQTYVSAGTTLLSFFQAAQADKTLGNIPQGGTLPRFQALQIHNICLDVLNILPVTINAAGVVTGVLNDLALLIMGSNERPTWKLVISDKSYGPYSLTTLHGTGGPWGLVNGTQAAGAAIMYAKNAPEAGWNYLGRVILPELVNFQLDLAWAAAATLTENKRLRVSLMGVLNRRSL